MRHRPRAPGGGIEDVALKTAPAQYVQLHGMPTARLIPAAVLEPRIRLVDGGDLIEGSSFDLGAIMKEEATPSWPIRANGHVRDRVMASFEASRNRNNRFNAVGDPGGVYYAGTTLPTSIEEIRWHLENDKGVPFDRTRIYRVVTARIDGRFLDLRGTGAKALNPDTAIGYPAGQELARRVRDRCDGIIYPSARNPEGVNIAVFNPESVHDIRLDRFLSFERVPGEGPVRFGYRNHIQQHRAQAMGMALAVA